MIPLERNANVLSHPLRFIKWVRVKLNPSWLGSNNRKIPAHMNLLISLKETFHPQNEDQVETRKGEDIDGHTFSPGCHCVPFCRNIIFPGRTHSPNRHSRLHGGGIGTSVLFDTSTFSCGVLGAGLEASGSFGGGSDAEGERWVTDYLGKGGGNGGGGIEKGKRCPYRHGLVAVCWEDCEVKIHNF